MKGSKIAVMSAAGVADAAKSGFPPRRKAILLAILLAGVLASAIGIGASVDYRYDDLGRLTDAVYADGKVIQYRYDNNGNILQARAVLDPLFKDGFEQ